MAFGTCNSVALYEPKVIKSVKHVSSLVVFSLLSADANVVRVECLFKTPKNIWVNMNSLNFRKEELSLC